jgi:hypothetical protein
MQRADAGSVGSGGSGDDEYTADLRLLLPADDGAFLNATSPSSSTSSSVSAAVQPRRLFAADTNAHMDNGNVSIPIDAYLAAKKRGGQNESDNGLSYATSVRLVQRRDATADGGGGGGGAPAVFQLRCYQPGQAPAARRAVKAHILLCGAATAAAAAAATGASKRAVAAALAASGVTSPGSPFNHPSLLRHAQLFVGRTAADPPCVVAEHCRNGTVKALLRRRIRVRTHRGGDANGVGAGVSDAATTTTTVHYRLLPEHVIMRWFAEVCLALCHLHANRIIHGGVAADAVHIADDAHARLGGFDTCFHVDAPQSTQASQKTNVAAVRAAAAAGQVAYVATLTDRNDDNDGSGGDGGGGVASDEGVTTATKSVTASEKVGNGGSGGGTVWGAHSLLSAAPELLKVRGGGGGELLYRILTLLMLCVCVCFFACVIFFASLCNPMQTFDCLR